MFLLFLLTLLLSFHLTVALPCQVLVASGGTGTSGKDTGMTNFNELCDGTGCQPDCSTPATSYFLPQGGTPTAFSGLSISAMSSGTATTVTITFSGTPFSSAPVIDLINTGATFDLRCSSSDGLRKTPPFGSCTLKASSNNQLVCTNLNTFVEDCRPTVSNINGPTNNGVQNTATWTPVPASTSILLKNPSSYGAAKFTAIIPDYNGIATLSTNSANGYQAPFITAAGVGFGPEGLYTTPNEFANYIAMDNNANQFCDEVYVTDPGSSPQYAICTKFKNDFTNDQFKWSGTTIAAVKGGQKQSSTPIATWTSPTVTNVQPLTGPTAGNFLITIFGSNIVATDSSGGTSAWFIQPVVYVGGMPCGSPYQYTTVANGASMGTTLTAGANIRAMTCTMMPMVGKDLTIRLSTYYGGVTHTDQGMNAATVKFTFATPTVTAIAVAGGVTASTAKAFYLFTIYGTSFGPPSTSPDYIQPFSVDTPQALSGTRTAPIGVVGTWACLSGQIVDDSTMTCIIPPGCGSQKVSVTIGGATNGQTAVSSANLITYAAPTFSGITAGTTTITITGDSFGPSGGTAGVAIGTWGACTPTSWGTTSIICTLPPACGTIPATSIVVTTACSATVASNVAITYALPDVTAIAPSSGAPSDGSTFSVTAFGTNFGPSGCSPKVVIPSWGTMPTTCSLTASDTQIICNSVPLNTPGPRDVKVTNSGATSTTFKTLTFSYPTLSSMLPTSPASYFKTAGGIKATIVGKNFGGFNPALQTNFGGWAVTVGGAAATGVTWISDTYLEIIFPQGYGVNDAVVVSMDSDLTATTTLTVATSNAPTIFSYAPPLFTAMAPTTPSTDGSQTCTLFGENFGHNSANQLGCTAGCSGDLGIKVGAFTSTASTWVSDNQVTFPCPAGSGLGLNIVARRIPDTQLLTSATGVFSYAKPVVSAILPVVSLQASSATNTAFTFTVFGTNFGPNLGPPATNTAVSFTSSPALFTKAVGATTNCKVVAHTQYLCTSTLMPGFGQDVKVAMSVNGIQGDDSTSNLFTYARPYITAFVPTAVETGNTFTIHGLNFGPSGLASGAIGVTVLVETVNGTPSSTMPCSTSATWTSSYIICVGAPGPAFGIGHLVTISLTGDTAGASTYIATAAGKLDYAPPVITAVDPATAASDPGAGIMITIMGKNFGPSGTTYATKIGSFTCGTPTWVADSQVQCEIPPGVGAQLSVSVSITGNGASVANTRFTYAAPTVIGLSPATGPGVGGNFITVTGTNLGYAGFTNTVIVIGAKTATNCVGFAGGAQVVCKAPPQGGIDYSVLLSVASDQAAPTKIDLSVTPKYSYSAPVVSSITPTSAGTGLVQYTVTIDGVNFGGDSAQAITAFLGDGYQVVSCSHDSTNPTISDARIYCNHGGSTTTGGAGAGVNVKVVSPASGGNAQSGSTDALFTYNAPTVTVVSQAAAGTVLGAGKIITIYGNNFGPTGTAALVNIPTLNVGGFSSVCSTPVVTGHTMIVCTAPPGVGSAHSIAITQNIAPSATWAKGTNPSVTQANYYTYTAPLFSSVTSGAALTTVGGTFVTISGLHFGPARTNLQIISGEGINLYYADTIPKSFTFACTNVVVVTNTQLSCTGPAGVGKAINVGLTLGHATANVQSSTTTTTGPFSFNAPTVSAVVPNLQGTDFPAIPAQLTIYGTGFGFATAITSQVNQGQLGSFTAWGTADLTVVSDGMMVVQSAAVLGYGTGLAIKVTAGFNPHAQTVTSASLFTFSPPTVLSMNPASGPTAGGTTVTITGTNFGHNVGATTVTFGIASTVSACTSVTWINQSNIKCVTPGGVGGNIAVTITVGGQSASKAALWDYAPPTITHIVPSTRLAASSNTDDITIYGTDFGQSYNTRLIQIGTLTCTEQGGGNSWISTSAVRCQHPPGTGKDLVVSLSTGGKIGTSNLNSKWFTNAAPQVTGINPVTSGPTLGGTVITLLGLNFGVAGSGDLVTATIDAFPCNTATVLSDTHLKCTTSAGRGVGLLQTVAIGPTALNVQSSANSTGTFSYNAPQITASAYLPPPGGLGGALVTIYGSNFGAVDAGPSELQAYFGFAGAPLSQRVALNAVTWKSDTMIIATAPPWAGASLSIFVSLKWNEGQSAANLFTYAAPNVTSVFPATGPTIPSSYLITVYGNNFGPTAYETTVAAAQRTVVTVGGNTCVTQPPTATTHADSVIVCALPSGTGKSLNVAVSINGGVSVANTRFTYVAPIVTVLAQPSAGPKKGNTLITVSGFNFGPIPQPTNFNVTIAGIPCLNVTLITADTTLVCTTGNFFGTTLTPDMLPNYYDSTNLAESLIVCVNYQCSKNPAPTPWFTYLEFTSTACTKEVAANIEYAGSQSERLRLNEEYFKNIAPLDPANMPNQLAFAGKTLRMTGSKAGTSGCIPRKSGGGAPTTQHCYPTDDQGANRPEDLLDNDRCCSNFYNMPCGLHWAPTSPANTINTINVRVDLFQKAYVNGILVSFFNPCVNEALPYYNLFEWNTGTNAWDFFYQRTTGVSDTPCNVIPGNSGAMSLCQDYFTGRIVTKLELRFDNQFNKLDGGWMMEFEVHGIYGISPYRLKTTPTTLTYLPSDYTTTFKFLVETLNYDKMVPPSVTLGTSDKETVQMYAAIRGPLPSLTYVPLQGTPTNITLVGAGVTPSTVDTFGLTQNCSGATGQLNWANLSLTTPKVGNYNFTFFSPGLFPIDYTVIVYPGTPVTIVATRIVNDAVWTTTSTVKANTLVLMPPFRVQALDPGGNFVTYSNVSYGNITVTCGTSTARLAVMYSGGTNCLHSSIAGNTNLQMFSGLLDFSNATNSSLYFSYPAVGSYQIRFCSTTTLGCATAPLSVVAGDPVAMFVETKSTVNSFDALAGRAGTTLFFASAQYVKLGFGANPLETRVMDASLDPQVEVTVDANDPTRTASREYFATLTDVPAGSPAVLAGPQRYGPQFGTSVKWQDLTLFEPRVGNYTVTFSSPNTTLTAAPTAGWKEGMPADLLSVNITVVISLGPTVRGLVEVTPASCVFPACVIDLPSAPIVSVPSVTVFGVDGGNNKALTVGDTYNVTLALNGSFVPRGASAPAGTLPRNIEDSGTGLTRLTTNSVVSWSTLFLTRPPAGLYYITATSTKFQALYPLAFGIVRVVYGTPEGLWASNWNNLIKYPSLGSVPLPSIDVWVIDAGGNRVFNQQGPDVIPYTYDVSLDPASIVMPTTIVNGSCTFPAMALLSPFFGGHIIEFATNPITAGWFNATINVTIAEGLVTSLWVDQSLSWTFPTSEPVFLGNIDVYGRDAGGTNVGPVDTDLRGLRATLVGTPPGVTMGLYGNSTTTQMKDGKATFPNNVMINRPPPGLYRVRFSVENTTGNSSVAPFDLDVTIVPGTVVIPRFAGAANASGIATASNDGVTLPAITLDALDAGGTVKPFELTNPGIVTASIDPIASGLAPALTGTVTRSSSPVAGTVSYSSTDLVVVGPDYFGTKLSGARSGSFTARFTLTSKTNPAFTPIMNGQGLVEKLYSMPVPLSVSPGVPRTIGTPGMAKNCSWFIGTSVLQGGFSSVDLMPWSKERMAPYFTADVSGAAAKRPGTLPGQAFNPYDLASSRCFLVSDVVTVGLGPIKLTTLNAGFDPIGLMGNDPTSRPVTVTLEYVSILPTSDTDQNRRTPPNWVEMPSDPAQAAASPFRSNFSVPYQASSTIFTPFTGTMTNGVLDTPDVKLTFPFPGTYRLRMASPGLEDGFLKIVIVPGPPAGLRVQLPPPAVHEPGTDKDGKATFLRDVVLYVIDMNDNTVPTVGYLLSSRAYAYIQKFPIPSQTTATTIGANLTTLNPYPPGYGDPKNWTDPDQRTVIGDTGTGDEKGTIVYAAGRLGFMGYRDTNYTMEFVGSLSRAGISTPLPISGFATVYIQKCGVTVPDTVMNVDKQEECFCTLGFTEKGGISRFAPGACTLCPDGTFKDKSGWQACTACTERNPNQDNKVKMDTRSFNYYEDGDPDAIGDPLATNDLQMAQATGLGAKNETRCRCARGYFAREANPLACEPCPKGGVCKGGTTLIADKGWWRRTENSAVFFECPSTAACEGGSNSTCKEGSTGPLCSICTEGYGLVGQQCSKCPKQNNAWLLFAASVFVIVGIIAFLIRSQKNTNWNYTTATVIQKILLNYMQMLSLFGSYSIKWPPSVNRMFQISEGTSSFSQDLYTVSCAVRSNYYTKLTFYLLIPVMGMILPLIVFTLWHFIRKGVAFLIRRPYYGTGGDVLNLSLLATLIIIFMTHPTVSRQVFNVFNCRDMDGVKFLVQDLAVTCEDSMYLFWKQIAFIVLFAFCLGVPIYGFILLFFLRKKLTLPGTRSRFGFLYIGLREKVFYWEMVTILRKLGVVYCVVFINKNPIHQVFASLWLVQFAILGHLLFKPFEALLAQRLELASLFSGFVTLMVGLMFEPTVGFNEKTQNYLVYALFATNGTTFLLLAVFLIRGKILMRLTKSEKVIDWKRIAGEVFEGDGQENASRDLYWLFQDKAMHLQDAAIDEAYKKPLQSILAEMIVDPGKSMTPQEVENIPAPVIDAVLNEMKPEELAALDAIARSLAPDGHRIEENFGADDDLDFDDWGEEEGTSQIV